MQNPKPYNYTLNNKKETNIWYLERKLNVYKSFIYLTLCKIDKTVMMAEKLTFLYNLLMLNENIYKYTRLMNLIKGLQ